jgi:hypothetical protein
MANMSCAFSRIGLNGYRILGYDNNQKVVIRAQLRQRPKSCLYCGAQRLRSKGRYRPQARHLDCFGVMSQLLVQTHRYRCVDCGRSFIPSLPGLLPWLSRCPLLGTGKNLGVLTEIPPLWFAGA